MQYTLQLFRPVGGFSVNWVILGDDRHMLWNGIALDEQQATQQAFDTYLRYTGLLPINGLSDRKFVVECLGAATLPERV